MLGAEHRDNIFWQGRCGVSSAQIQMWGVEPCVQAERQRTDAVGVENTFSDWRASEIKPVNATGKYSLKVTAEIFRLMSLTILNSMAKHLMLGKDSMRWLICASLTKHEIWVSPGRWKNRSPSCQHRSQLTAQSKQEWSLKSLIFLHSDTCYLTVVFWTTTTLKRQTYKVDIK